MKLIKDDYNQYYLVTYIEGVKLMTESKSLQTIKKYRRKIEKVWNL